MQSVSKKTCNLINNTPLELANLNHVSFLPIGKQMMYVNTSINKVLIVLMVSLEKPHLSLKNIPTVEDHRIKIWLSAPWVIFTGYVRSELYNHRSSLEVKCALDDHRLTHNDILLTHFGSVDGV